MSSNFINSVSSGKQGFNPYTLDNGTTKLLRAWFDPRDPSKRTIVSGRVTSLTNIVSGVAAVEESSNGPLLGTSLNNGPCLIGDTTKYLVGTEANILNCWSNSSGLNAHTIIVLVQGQAASNAGCIFGVGRSDQTFNQSSALELNSIADSSNCYTYARTPNSTTVQWYGGSPTQTPVAIASSWNGTTPLLRVNGSNISLNLTAASGTPPGAVSSPDRFAILARGRQNFAGKFLGYIGPILIYSGQLTTGECDAATEGLLRWYGLL